MPKRILTYLDKMDELRDETDLKVDETLARLDVNKLMTDPKETLRFAILQFLKKNNWMFKQARREGIKLADSLK